jgi:PEP-CTERM motif
MGNSSNATTNAWSLIPEGSSNARVPTTTPWSDLAWGVIRIDHIGDTTVFDNAYMWVNPDPNVEPLIANAAASSIGAFDFSNLDAMRPFVGNLNGASPAGQLLLDEVRIGTDYASMSAVPEPGAVALVTLGGLGLLLRRRR